VGNGEMMSYRLLLALIVVGVARAADGDPLEIEARIPLGDVHGRIDHMAIDPARQRLYVAELGNNSVGVVDLRERKTLRSITGLKEPQGIGYVASTDTLYVANAGDGSVRLYQGADLTPAGQIPLGDDADNVRVDDATHRIFVGYGSGALAVIDTQSRQKIADIRLKAHPESFQLQPSGQQIFVNVPDAREIAVVDRARGKQVGSWSTDSLRANFPMALDPTRGSVYSVFRRPAALGVFEMQNSRLLYSVSTCADSDDVFLEARRSRIYVSCGEGYIGVFAQEGDRYKSLGRISTAAGARTSFFDPSIDRLLLAARATAEAPASIWVLRPRP
jgi:YVTN family beta-propeller protein